MAHYQPTSGTCSSTLYNGEGGGEGKREGECGETSMNQEVCMHSSKYSSESVIVADGPARGAWSTLPSSAVLENKLRIEFEDDGGLLAA